MTGLSQAELAHRLGTQQSLISLDERGARTPTVATLERMVDAAGLRLTWDLAHGGSGGGPMAALAGPIGRLVVERRAAIQAQLAERGLTGARIAGPVATSTERPGEMVLIVVDDGPDGGRPPTPDLLVAAGAISALVGGETMVIPSCEAERYGLDSTELARAVPLA